MEWEDRTERGRLRQSHERWCPLNAADHIEQRVASPPVPLGEVEALWHPDGHGGPAGRHWLLQLRIFDEDDALQAKSVIKPLRLVVLGCEDGSGRVRVHMWDPPVRC